jgi:hypothetical protein
MTYGLTRSLIVAAAGSLCLTAPLLAQPGPPSPTTEVLATLTINKDVARSDLLKILPEEVRATVRLYLEGKIQQWYGRADGTGVVFILNCTNVAEAQALTDQLPLAKNHLATFAFIALTPLTPLRALLAEPAASKDGFEDDHRQ